MVDLSEGLLIDTSWLTSPLRHVAITLNSNVDKKFKSGEIPVRLCNYVDVYRRPIIGPDVPFMNATATNAEIERFRIRIGDVVITKDSESWLDIGVPTLVAYEAQDLLCGYHLCILRPDRSKMTGSYLARVLTVPGIVSQLHVRAKGVTRYGLSQSAIKAALIPVPPIEMQKVINRYLDHAELRIARAIQAKVTELRSIIELRTATVAREILGNRPSKVLNPYLPYRVPDHWQVVPLWSVAPLRSDSGHGNEQLLSVYLNRGVILYSESGGQVHKPSASLDAYQLVEPGDLVLNNQQAWRGSVGVSSHRGIISPAYVVCALDSRIDSTWANFLFRSPAMVDQFVMASRGVGSIQRQLHMQSLRRIMVPLPPLEEQRETGERLSNSIRELDEMAISIQREIDLLREYRTRLIADVVTGTKDVRAEATNLPEVDPLELAQLLSGGLAIEEDVDEEVSADAD
jgi:type I restriction enzyme S subunit